MLCTPALCPFTYINYAWTALSHPYRFTAGRAARRKTMFESNLGIPKYVMASKEMS